MGGQELDYYALLGVNRNASAAEIARAYRRAARATHPDIHREDSSAAQRFSAVAIAYETLSNPIRRASYDRTQVRVDPIRITQRRTRAVDTDPIRLGRPHDSRRPFQTYRASRATPFEPVVDDLLELIAMLTRLPNRWVP